MTRASAEPCVRGPRRCERDLQGPGSSHQRRVAGLSRSGRGCLITRKSSASQAADAPGDGRGAEGTAGWLLAENPSLRLLAAREGPEGSGSGRALPPGLPRVRWDGNSSEEPLPLCAPASSPGKPLETQHWLVPTINQNESPPRPLLRFSAVAAWGFCCIVLSLALRRRVVPVHEQRDLRCVRSKFLETKEGNRKKKKSIHCTNETKWGKKSRNSHSAGAATFLSDTLNRNSPLEERC